MLSKVIQFVKDNIDDIILFIGVVLISLLSFALGYLMAKEQLESGIRIEQVSFLINLV